MMQLAPSAFDSRDCRMPGCMKESEWPDGMCGEHAGRQIIDKNGGLIPGALAHLGDKAQSAGRSETWDRGSIIIAIQKHAAEHGAPPRMADWNRIAPGRPSADMVKRRFGSWADAIVAAGFPRPVRGGIGRRRASTSNEKPKSEVWTPAPGKEPPSRTLAGLATEIEELEASIEALTAARARTLADLADLINEMAA